jgi:hypothetical protein
MYAIFKFSDGRLASVEVITDDDPGAGDCCVYEERRFCAHSILEIANFKNLATATKEPPWQTNPRPSQNPLRQIVKDYEL